MRILGVESSCDDTAAAVLENDRLLANVISSQFDVHAPFGGIVPELASRSHIEAIWPVVQQALHTAETSLEDIDLICATQGPGLVGSLLVGLTFAKSIALVKDIPCVGVDHMAGHLLAIFLDPGQQPEFPYIALIVSGGNTAIYEVRDHYTFLPLGRTRDDAAGEAFDKVAKLLDLGYPGGPAVSKAALKGDPAALQFPRAMLDRDNLDFSFSGIKTAVVNHVNQCRQKNTTLAVEDICASFQEAVVEVLVAKTLHAAIEKNIPRIVLGGGVSANRRLRDAMQEGCTEKSIQFLVPKPVFCTDNAAMIALAGFYKYQNGETIGPDSDAYSRSPLN